jgi:hypothetical protein
MIGTDLTSTNPGKTSTGTSAVRSRPDLAAIRGSSNAPGRASGPSVRIAKRRQLPPWKNPRRLDPATIGKFLILGKCRGLFLRNCVLRFRGTAAKARRAVKGRPKARPARRWEPVVISPVFPRGPLALPSLGFLQDGLNRRRELRGRWAKGRRMAYTGVDQNLSRAACSSP